jgi:hypothetical protein
VSYSPLQVQFSLHKSYGRLNNIPISFNSLINAFSNISLQNEFNPYVLLALIQLIVSFRLDIWNNMKNWFDNLVIAIANKFKEKNSHGDGFIFEYIVPIIVSSLCKDSTVQISQQFQGVLSIMEKQLCNKNEKERVEKYILGYVKLGDVQEKKRKIFSNSIDPYLVLKSKDSNPSYLYQALTSLIVMLIKRILGKNFRSNNELYKEKKNFKKEFNDIHTYYNKLNEGCLKNEVGTNYYDYVFYNETVLFSLYSAITNKDIFPIGLIDDKKILNLSKMKLREKMEKIENMFEAGIGGDGRVFYLREKIIFMLLVGADFDDNRFGFSLKFCFELYLKLDYPTLVFPLNEIQISNFSAAAAHKLTRFLNSGSLQNLIAKKMIVFLNVYNNIIM